MQNNDPTFLIEEEWDRSAELKSRDFGQEIMNDMTPDEFSELITPIFEDRIERKVSLEKKFKQLRRQVKKSYAPDTAEYDFVLQARWSLDGAKEDFANEQELEAIQKYWLTNQLRAQPHDKQNSRQDNFHSQIQIAKQFPIEDLLTRPCRRSGSKTLVSLCPFHEEKSPSFTIYQNTNTYYCFGCKVRGDSIDYYQKTHGLEFADAVRALSGGITYGK
jgi:hypothetical protein